MIPFLAKKGIIASYTQSPNGDIWSAFSSGLASMTQTVRALVPSFRSSMKDDWDVCFTPKINGVHKTGMGSLAMDATPSGVKNNADLVYDFITWYYSADGAMGILSSTYAIVPPVESLYDSPVWRKLPGPPGNTSVFSDSIAFGAINPNTIPHAVQSVINKQLRDAEDSVVLTGADPKEQLTNAEAAVNQAWFTAASALVSCSLGSAPLSTTESSASRNCLLITDCTAWGMVFGLIAPNAIESENTLVLDGGPGRLRHTGLL